NLSEFSTGPSTYIQFLRRYLSISTLKTWPGNNLLIILDLGSGFVRNARNPSGVFSTTAHMSGFSVACADIAISSAATPVGKILRILLSLRESHAARPAACAARLPDQIPPRQRLRPPSHSALQGSRGKPPAARCKNVRRGSFILNLPSHHSITSSATEQRYELASLHSIPSSARAMAIGECREEHHVEGRAR